jgi:prophage regulatory protein
MTETQQFPIAIKKVLTLDELVEYTGFKKPTIHLLTSSGRIPFSKPTGRTLFFEREKIDAWLLSNPHKTNAEIQQEATKYTTKNRRKT